MSGRPTRKSWTAMAALMLSSAILAGLSIACCTYKLETDSALALRTKKGNEAGSATGPRSVSAGAATLPQHPLERASAMSQGIPGSLGDPAFDILDSSPNGGLSYGEELWVIRRSKVLTQPGSDVPRSGELRTTLPEKHQEVAVPLKHTEVKGRISGYIATVEVAQQFHNPYDSKIEAVYVFPLPQDAAVNEFVMTIGSRKIRGIIREREEAEQIYQEAKSQGHVASLLTQERPNIFTQAVANIEPGKSIDINIKYFHTLAYDDGWYEWVFPMVVGPRFNPPGSKDGIGAVGRGSRGKSVQKSEVQYLKPGERSGHDISLSVTVDAGVVIEAIRSVNHVIESRRTSPEVAEITLSELDAIPDKDFVLRYKVAGKQMKSALLTQRDARGGYFTLMLYPPEGLASLPRRPIELVFVLDCSGSMNGKPIEQAKAAVERGLRRMGEGDTFQIVQFSNTASHFGANPVAATKTNVTKALDYVRSLNGEGGTMMIEGIKAALDFPHDDNRLRSVAFLTDGYIGNEAEILGEVHRRLGTARIFCFGVGSSPNRYLLNHLARMGRGAVAYLSLNDSGSEVMDTFFECISHPAMTDIQVDFGSMRAHHIFPAQAPDLFVGRPVILTGRFDGHGDTTIGIKGRIGGEDGPLTLSAKPDDAGNAHAGISAVWARMQIADLADRSSWQRDFDAASQIKTVALEYGLMSPFTAFLAVDSLTKTDGDHGTTVAVPVPVPDGVRYDTTVRER